MKKLYMKPIVEVVKVQTCTLLAGSESFFINRGETVEDYEDLE